MPERHLGLHLAAEILTEDRLASLADWIEAHIDLDRLLELGARPAFSPPVDAPQPAPIRTRIGIARDAAFCFYYSDNLDLLRDLGAELVQFRPISDQTLPRDLDGLYLGGGYPELHAESLSVNQSMQSSIASFAASGAPIHAECGGFMYLTRAIVGVQGKSWTMAGIFPAVVRMQTRMAKLGYIEIESCEADGWLAPGARAYRDPAEGYRIESVLGSYIHLHFYPARHSRRNSSAAALCGVNAHIAD